MMEKKDFHANTINLTEDAKGLALMYLVMASERFSVISTNTGKMDSKMIFVVKHLSVKKQDIVLRSHILILVHWLDGHLVHSFGEEYGLNIRT